MVGRNRGFVVTVLLLVSIGFSAECTLIETSLVLLYDDVEVDDVAPCFFKDSILGPFTAAGSSSSRFLDDDDDDAVDVVEEDTMDAMRFHSDIRRASPSPSLLDCSFRTALQARSNRTSMINTTISMNRMKPMAEPSAAKKPGHSW